MANSAIVSGGKPTKIRDRMPWMKGGKKEEKGKGRRGL